MMISKQQATAAARELAAPCAQPSQTVEAAVSRELIERALDIARNAPASSAERLAEARQSLESGAHDSYDVASMMIQRIVSDALR
jgi:hypothetical protein